MTAEKETTISKTSDKKLLVLREFDAPVNDVWDAWTQNELLDIWWAPKPWKARTKTMQSEIGGYWLYAMVGPDGEEQWCRVDFRAIQPTKSFSFKTYFCDENGNQTDEFPPMEWKIVFSSVGNITKIEVDITFDSEADMEKIVALGFKEGFTAALGNLDELLAERR